MNSIPRSQGRNERFTLFHRCGICGKVVDNDRIGIVLQDNDWEPTMQYYHRSCYGSRFDNTPRNRILMSNSIEVPE